MRKAALLIGLLVLAVALGIWSVAGRATDCAYAPDGNLRWNAVGDWFVDPGYDQDRAWRTTGPPCDVWQGIMPQKPIGTVQLEERTDALGPIVARIAPDGSGFVAVFKPYMADRAAVDAGRKFATMEEFARHSTVFPISENAELYRRVSKLLGPIRDFQGQSDAIEWAKDDPLLRQALELNDPRTKFTVCRREATTMPWLGTSIEFGSEESGGEPRLYFDNSCADVAYYAMTYRRQKAFDAIIGAADAAAFIQSEQRGHYPECANFRRECYDYIL